MKLAGLLSLSIAAISLVAAQVQSQPSPERALAVDSRRATAIEEATAGGGAAAPMGYILGPGDQIVVRVVDADQIGEKPVQVDMSGYIRLPMIGRVKVGGLNIAQAEVELVRLFKTFILKPDISIAVQEFRSQPVSVIGAVKTPGVHQVQGRKTLVEVLSLAGGLDTTAGPTIRITRQLEYGRIPLAGAEDDSTGKYSIAQVSLKELLEAKTPQANILVKPFDVISVPLGETVYVIGQVLKAGGFVLKDSEEISVLQAVSMAGGLDRMAQAQNAKILRRMPGATNRTEIAVDLRKILDGRIADVPMKPEDILFVPDNVPKRATLRTIEAVIQAGTGVVIWRR